MTTVTRILTFIAATAVGTCSAQGFPRRTTIEWDCGDPLTALAWQALDPQVPDADAAFRLANAILCEKKTDALVTGVTMHLDDIVMQSSYGTGEPAEEVRILKKRRAAEHVHYYDGTLDRTYEVVVTPEREIELDAWNEACVDTTTLRHRNREWRIYKVGDACD